MCTYTNTAPPVPDLADLLILITAPTQTQLTPAALGPGAEQNVSVTNPLPMGLTFASNTGAYTIPFPCALGNLVAGQSRVITTTLSKLPGFDPSLPIILTAPVTNATPDPDPANNNDSVVIGSGIPTLPQWGMILLTLSLLALATWQLAGHARLSVVCRAGRPAGPA